MELEDYNHQRLWRSIHIDASMKQQVYCGQDILWPKHTVHKIFSHQDFIQWQSYVVLKKVCEQYAETKAHRDKEAL